MPVLIHRQRFLRWLIFASFLGASWESLPAQTLAAREYIIKAAFLYNFVKLTEWPTNAFDSSKSPITIGIIGKDPFGRVLEDTVRGKTVDGRNIVIVRFKERDEDIRKCQLLFIAKSENEHLDEIFSLVAKKPVLTVGEIDRFNYRGGMIWLMKKGDEIKFRIRQSAAREVGIKFSSKLLALSYNAKSKLKEEK